MVQKSRPIEAFEQVLSAFKTFEKKLDKLHDDVNSHGHALTDLRTMVSNLAVGPDIKMVPTRLDAKRLKKSTAAQYDNLLPSEGFKTKRKNTLKSMQSKTKAKSCPAPKLLAVGADSNFAKPASLSKVKHSSRPGKAWSQRQTTTLRTQKGREKNKPKTKTK